MKKNTYQPEWYEKLVFTDLCPSLCQRIKIQLMDSDTAGKDDVIGTHFLDLSKISNDGTRDNNDDKGK